jgi:hypothetical protein
LKIIHGRSVSSPANLVQSLAVKTTPQHSRQNSFDGLLDAAQSPLDAAACNQQRQQQQSAWPNTAGKYPRYRYFMMVWKLYLYAKVLVARQ